MAQVKRWLDAFLLRHRARYGPHDWPMHGTEEFDEFMTLWLTSFATGEVSESEADAASLRCAGDPPRFRNEHIVKVIDQVKALREERGAPATTREDARDRSRDCEYCCGNGLVSVYHPTPDHERRIPVSVGAHCICPHGRWMRRKLGEREEDRHLMRRIPDFADVLDGRSIWLAEMPGVLPFDGKPRVVRDYGACLKR